MKKYILTFLLSFLSLNTYAEELKPLEEKETIKKSWGVEFDLVQPFIPTVNIFSFRGSKTIIGEQGSAHGDITIGGYIRPNIEHDVVDRISEYQISIGYRQYFIAGLHAEANYMGGYVWGTNNKIDKKNYEGFVHFVEALVGYRFDLFTSEKFGLYVTPQFGIFQGLNKELIIGPRGGKPDSFLQGKLLVGLSF